MQKQRRHTNSTKCENVQMQTRQGNHSGKLRISGIPKTKKKFKVLVLISESPKLE
jgi:hypothetical protein